MPEFKNREEYEKWKAQKIKDNEKRTDSVSIHSQQEEQNTKETSGYRHQYFSGPAENVVYAGFWRRVMASLVDFIVWLFISVIFVVALYALTGSGLRAANSLPANLFTFIASWLYSAIMESSDKQATLGKMAIGIVVTDLEGNKISFGKATGRYFAKILSTLILLIGYMMAGFTQKKQALHDMMAGTLVVVKQ